MTIRATLALICCLAPLLLAGCGGGQKPVSLDDEYKDALAYSDPESKAQALVKVARKQARAGDIAGAEKSFNAARKAVDDVDSPAGKASALNALAYAEARASMIGRARETLGDTLRAVGGMEDHQAQAIEYGDMAVTYGLYLDEETKAQTFLVKACKLAEESASAANPANTLMEVAYDAYLLKDEKQADAIIAQAIAAARAAEAVNDKVSALVVVIEKLARMKKEEEAKKLLDDAVAITKTMPSDSPQAAYSKAYAMVKIAVPQARLGEKKAAKALLDEALDLANEKVKDDSGLQRDAKSAIADALGEIQ